MNREPDSARREKRDWRGRGKSSAKRARSENGPASDAADAAMVCLRENLSAWLLLPWNIRAASFGDFAPFLPRHARDADAVLVSHSTAQIRRADYQCGSQDRQRERRGGYGRRVTKILHTQTEIDRKEGSREEIQDHVIQSDLPRRLLFFDAGPINQTSRHCQERRDQAENNRVKRQSDHGMPPMFHWESKSKISAPGHMAIGTCTRIGCNGCLSHVPFKKSSSHFIARNEVAFPPPVRSAI